MKIYTKTGDQGETGLLGGQRISKASSRISALGVVDELNASIGFARSVGLEASLDSILAEVQNRLFDLGAELAAVSGSEWQIASIQHRHILPLETDIDRMTAILPPLQRFILPGGTQGSAAMHVARGVCRRAERVLLELHTLEPLRDEVIAYLNRLSDWLFTAARYENHVSGNGDVFWEKENQP